MTASVPGSGSTVEVTFIAWFWEAATLPSRAVTLASSWSKFDLALDPLQREVVYEDVDADRPTSRHGQRYLGLPCAVAGLGRRIGSIPANGLENTKVTSFGSTGP